MAEPEGRKGVRIVSRSPGKNRACLILAASALVATSVAVEAGSSSRPSTSLSSTQSSSNLHPASTQSSGARLDWLNQRLSETRSPLIRTKLGEDAAKTSTIDRLDQTYLQRRQALNERLNRALGETPEGSTRPEGGALGGGDLSPLPFKPFDERSAENVDGMESDLSLEAERPMEIDLSPRLDRTRGDASQQALLRLPSTALLRSQPLESQSQWLEGSAPMSTVPGHKPFEIVVDGEIVDERLLPLLQSQAEAEAEAEADVEMPEERPLVLPLEDRIPPTVVRPAVPEMQLTPYEMQSERLWSQVPVRQPRTSQFGPGVNPSQIPFEGSGVRNSGVYGGYYRAPTSDPVNRGYSYQYRGPRLYSIGESEYPTGGSYQSLPYYRR